MARRRSQPEQEVGALNFGLGARLRHARLASGLYMKELAEKAGCSEGFISKIESDKVLPSLAMLHRIAESLGISIARLVDDRRSGCPVDIYRPGEPVFLEKAIRTGNGISLESIVAAGSSDLLQINIHHVEPGGSSEGTIMHRGEEFGYVLKGCLQLEVAGETYQLTEGEAFFFRSDLPHGYRNPGASTALILWVNTPPTF
jgi:transcriptional regulator with XRE-family HTH domain